ncbi:MAG: hypothetical protein R2712_19515 [Vicinamibacterales bacterium]
MAREGLAEWCDVRAGRCCAGPDATRVLAAGVAHGLKPRIHADELALSGGSAVAAAVGCRSADHLIFVDEAHAARGCGGRHCHAPALPPPSS